MARSKKGSQVRHDVLDLEGDVDLVSESEGDTDNEMIVILDKTVDDITTNQAYDHALHICDGWMTLALSVLLSILEVANERNSDAKNKKKRC